MPPSPGSCAGNSSRADSVGSDVELVGRDSELAALDDALAAARAGSARTVGVLGEAGIGKTALLDALAARARHKGLLVLRGRGAEHERDVPYGLVVDALDDHVATLGPQRLATIGSDLGAVLPAAGGEASASPGAAERFRHHRALRALLELLAREQPLALILDDLHWADDASVELVLHLPSPRPGSPRRPPRRRPRRAGTRRRWAS